jgi:hypothetical protein
MSLPAESDAEGFVKVTRRGRGSKAASGVRDNVQGDSRGRRSERRHVGDPGQPDASGAHDDDGTEGPDVSAIKASLVEPLRELVSSSAWR